MKVTAEIVNGKCPTCNQFTMLVGDVENRLEILRRQRPVDTIILVGIETHVCIIATCIDLIHRGFNVSWNINSKHFMIHLSNIREYLLSYNVLDINVYFNRSMW